MKELHMYRQSLVARYRQAGEDLETLVLSIPSQERQAVLERSEEERAENCLEYTINTLFQDRAISVEQVIERVRVEEIQVNFPQIQKLLADLPDLPQPMLRTRDGNRRGDPLEAGLDEILSMRRQVSDGLEALPPVAWSLKTRYPSTGVRTLQWWVERSLGVVEAALHVLTVRLHERASPQQANGPSR